MASQLPGHFKGAAICKGWEEKKKKKGGKIRLKQEEEAETDSETSSSDTETTGRVQERVVASRDNIKDPMVEATVKLFFCGFCKYAGLSFSTFRFPMFLVFLSLPLLAVILAMEVFLCLISS